MAVVEVRRPGQLAGASALDEYLDSCNCDRAHTGRLTKGRVPADIVFGARKMGTVSARVAAGGHARRHPPVRSSSRS
jgi:hypothetical protein